MGIALFTLRSMAYALLDPTLAFVLIILCVVLYSQNRKTTVMQKMIIGESLNSPLELTVSQLVLGIFAGVIASLILSYCGVMFDENSGIEFIFLISIVLMFWSPRLICFSYSGAVLGLISVLLNDVYSKYYGAAGFQDIINVDIVALMTLVGVLHFVEGILVLIDGGKGSIPVFTNKENKIIGGFALKRYWPIPIILLIVTKGDNSIAGDMISTPDKWPLINSHYTAEFLKYAILGISPIFGVLGYNSITFTKHKTEKSISSGIGIVIYGIVLCFVAQLAAYGIAWKLFVLIFAPAAHEIMLRIQKYLEIEKSPRYCSDGDGVMILEVAPNSPAAIMGMKSGDTLLEINDNKIISEEDLSNFIGGVINYVRFKIKRLDGKIEELNYTNLSKEKRLGVVFVPKGLPKDSMVVKFEEGKFRDILDKIKNKDKDNDNDDES